MPQFTKEVGHAGTTRTRPSPVMRAPARQQAADKSGGEEGLTSVAEQGRTRYQAVSIGVGFPANPTAESASPLLRHGPTVLRSIRFVAI